MNKVITIVVSFIFFSIAIFAFAGGGKLGSVTGTVTSQATGKVIAGANVTDGRVNATTNSLGVYSMSIKAGIDTITASATGYTTVSHPIVLPRAGSVTLNFVLPVASPSNGTITGTVKDQSTGAAINGAQVIAGTASTTSNSSGVYTLSVAPGSYTVTASANGYSPSSQPATVTTNTTTTVNFSLAKSAVTSNYRVIAWNDLGMHCACPTFSSFLLLPPFNTVRAQVFDVTGKDPVFLDETTRASLGLSVSYNMVENTDTNLPQDIYFKQWIAYSPKLFPGFQPIVNGHVMGIANFGLSGNMAYDSNLLDWKAVGIPAYPVPTGDPKKDIMTDPLGGPNRDPYLTADVFVKNSSGQVLAQTTTVVPVAFGGCCTCHLALGAANGYPSTPDGAGAYIGKLHGQNSSKIDLNYLDPDGDGVPGPIRCSQCHWDPAMLERSAPGFDLNVWKNFKILPGASFTMNDVHPSQYSFSDVLHRHHVQSALVLSTYDPSIATNCYACHPGNGVNCYRGAHMTKTGSPAMACYDCHGNLNQRVAAGQLTQPWQTSTLPSCISAATGITSAFTCHSSSTVGGTTYPATPELFGKFINSRGHKGSPKCQTCHGEPHAEAPSTLALDNVQLSNVQGSVVGATYPSGKNSTYALGVCMYCHPGKTSTWGVPPH